MSTAGTVVGVLTHGWATPEGAAAPGHGYRVERASSLTWSSASALLATGVRPPSAVGSDTEREISRRYRLTPLEFQWCNLQTL